MKIVSISISGYRQFKETCEIEVPLGLIGVCGSNGVGKSKLIEALGYCLYGPHRRVLPLGDRSSDLVSRAPGPVSPVKVSVVLEVGRQSFEIVRSAHGIGATFIRNTSEAFNLADTPSGVTAAVSNLLGLSPDAFHATCVARQKEVALLQSLRGPDRCKVVNRLIGVTAFETAKKEAKRHTDDLSKQLDQIKRRTSEAIISATEDVDQCKVQFELSSDNLEDHHSLREEAEKDLENATSRFHDCENELAALAQQRGEIQSLGPLLTAAESNLKSAESRLGLARDAAYTVEEAERYLEQTEHVPQALAIEHALETREYLFKSQDEIEKELRLYEQQLHRLNHLTNQTQEIDDTLSALQKEIFELTAAIQLASKEEEDAGVSIKRYTQRLSIASTLGAEGECETCGQQFGVNHHWAIENYQRQLQEAQELQRAANERIGNAQRAVTAHEKRWQQENDNRAVLLREMQLYQGAETLRAQALQSLRDIQRHLPELPPSLPGAQITYDAQYHEWLLEISEERARQEELKNQSRVTALTLPESIEGELLASGNVEHLRGRMLSLKAAVERIGAVTQELETARALKEECQRIYRVRGAEYEKAVAENASADQRVKSAYSQLEKAREMKRDEEKVLHEWRVAHTTAELFDRMLNEIIAEARPRLGQLMEDWAHTLMGARFNKIELTDDYGIKADNGSGLHSINHFSGGEQTLLAVMLRVAIAIYCQERAGFDAGFLVLDEIFGDQDASRRQGLVQFLREISNHFHQVLVVNHIETVTEQFDSIIEVEEIAPKSSRAFLRA